MKTIRYFFTLFLLALIFFYLSGCGGGGSEDEPEYPEQKLYNYCTTSPQPCNK